MNWARLELAGGDVVLRFVLDGFQGLVYRRNVYRFRELLFGTGWVTFEAVSSEITRFAG